MRHLEQLIQLREVRQQWRKSGHSVAFVPTMGNLHSGHLKLVRHASTLADKVIVSIYVNPMQFGANEDLDTYPRTLQADMDALDELGAAAVFTPGTTEVYPKGVAAQTAVEVPGISSILCGASRPGHFRGVATIVNKLFNMVQPDVAVFGKKDYQQLQVIRTMVADLSMPIEIVGVDTERESSGLAKSSRNGYLSAEQQTQAAVIYAQLRDVAQQLIDGNKNFEALQEQAQAHITQAGLKAEYFSIRRAQDLAPASPTDPIDSLVILAAAKLGDTRLIDNLEVASLPLK